MRRPPRTLALLLAATVAALLTTSCSSDGGSDGAATTTTARTTDDPTTTSRERPERPDGPAAALEAFDAPGEPFVGEATATALPEGYGQEEYVASGTATDYQPEGELGADGRWTLTPDTEAAYRTRVLVRRPKDPADASGVAVVEWLNVSGGVDANPDWSSLAEEIVRQGHTWVGVSAQLIGVEGGPVLVAPAGVEGIAGKGLKALDPDRYGTLDHPGDGYAFDIYTQVARAIRAGGDPTGGEAPTAVIAAGESQSAIALTAYYDGVQPLTEAFDGFFVHSRAFAALPFVAPGEYADLAGAMGATPEAVRFRDDLDAPILDLQAEGDVIGTLNSYAARQDDSATFRLWEVAGTAHADRHLLGSLADQLACGVDINDGPLHVVAKAGLRALVTWVIDGTEPPTAERLGIIEGDEPAIALDDAGIAIGGIRTPPVDVPVDVLSGAPGPDGGLICLLMGSTTPLPAADLAARYDDADDYRTQFEASADDAIDAGFVLAEDRDALLAYAQPDRVG